MEKPLRIGYLGPNGSFSHTAAILKFGQCVEYEPLTDIGSIFDEVDKGHCDLGVVPIENSTGGGVIETLDALIDSNVKVRAEVLMAIHHNLLANCGAGEVTKTITGIDMIMAAGFNWAPPSVLVDTMGAAAAVEMIDSAGLPVPEALSAAASSGETTRFFDQPRINIGKFFVAG